MSQTIFPNLGIQIVVDICSQMWLKSMRSSYRLYFVARKERLKKLRPDAFNAENRMNKTRLFNGMYHLERIDGRIHISIGLGCGKGTDSTPGPTSFPMVGYQLDDFRTFTWEMGRNQANFHLKLVVWGLSLWGMVVSFSKANKQNFNFKGVHTPLKTIMEPENHPFWKEHHLNQTFTIWV